MSDELFDVRSHRLAEIAVLSEASLALGGFKSELVTTVHVVELYLSAFSYSESFCGSAVCFDFSHG